MTTEQNNAFTYAKTLHDKGETYEAIATALNKKGHKSVIGKPYSGSLVSKLFLDNGIRKKGNGKPIKRKSKGGGVVADAGTDKWALLRMIEACSDLKPDSKRALLDLAFKEMLK